jgi:RNA polymerase sigma-70 factor (ECF subfamily)
VIESQSGNGGNERALSDENLVAGMRAGDSALYGILVRRYDRFLHYMTLRVVHDHADAEDLVQEAHLKAFKNLAQFEGRSSFATWLTTIAVRGAISHARKPSHRLARSGAMTALDGSDDGMATAALDPEQQVLQHEARQALRAAVAALPPSYRAVIVLRGIQELTTEETAHRLGISAQSVKMRVHRAKALLRADLVQRLGARTVRRKCDVPVDGWPGAPAGKTASRRPRALPEDQHELRTNLAPFMYIPEGGTDETR